MTLSYFKNKSICIVLIFVLILQSCTVYKRTPVSLEVAAATNNKVLVTSSKNAILHYKKIQQIDGIYYGVQIVKGKFVKIPLTQNEIKTIYIKDKTTSTILTIGIIVIPIAIVVIIINNSLQDIDLGTSL